jgi:hypothetical protein
MSEITSTAEMGLIEHDYDGEPGEVRNDIVSTKEAEGKGIEFHVSMRDHTFRDMEALIVEAAAQLIVGKRGERELARLIEAKCVEMVNAKATAKLETITAEIIDLPMTPQWATDKKPVTMREMLGLYGREFLMEMVGRDGKPVTDHWGRNDQRARITHLVEKAMDAKFKAEIEKSTNAVVAEIKAAILSRHNAMLAAEKARFMEALAKVSS